MKPERWEQIDELLEEALNREPAQRAAFLDKACGGDEELRKEVEALLSAHEKAGSFCEKPVLDAVARATARQPGGSLVGKRLGPYEILSLLGTGGMGEVYRAKDTILGRQVAVKVLPDTFAGDPESLARFEREARLLASLNHSNIAAIYGLEEVDGKRFLVLELVKGRTLAERLKKGRIPLDETLDICRQLAEGLEAAHENGIVHRDLKPANVKVTPEGKVKILDFGLAKAFPGQPLPVDPSRSPAIRARMTAPGVILGTAAYMSPEQARGKPVDKRTDIWAFGCVMYECLTGKRAFRGDSATELTARILETEPDWTLLPAGTPLFVRAVLRQCLQKDPKLRLHDVADVGVEMREGMSEPSAVVPATHRFSIRWALSAATAILAVGLVIGGLVAMKYLRPASAPLVVRSIVRLDPGQRLVGRPPGWPSERYRPSRTAMAISHDGRFIVYSAAPGNREDGAGAIPQLYLRRTDQMEANPIKGTEWGISPFLSPDDRWVGFCAGYRLVKIRTNGEGRTTLCSSRFPFGATWGPDNQIVFTDYESGLFMVSGDGGHPEALTSCDRTREESSHRLPHWLPNGKGVLFTVTRHDWDLHPRVALLDPAKREWRYLLEDAADARYVPTGHIVFLRLGTLMAVPFDTDSLALTGQPVAVLADISQALKTGSPLTNTGAGQFSFSDSGCLIYAPGGIFPYSQDSLVWVDKQGAEQPITSCVDCDGARLSPDGSRIVYQSEDRLWVYDIDRQTASPLTSDGKPWYPIWTPDGKRVTFTWMKWGTPNFYWQMADGSSPKERLTTSDLFQWRGAWSPDGRTLAFTEATREDVNYILLLDLQSRRVEPFLNAPLDRLGPGASLIRSDPAFSPDGRWLAYVSNESGRRLEVYVRPFPRKEGKWLISKEGGQEPLWARNGKQLFYRRDNQIWAVGIRTDTGFKPGKPRLLFERPGLYGGDSLRGWDISLNGQRFLMVKKQDTSPQPVTELILVQHWFDELSRLCPTGKN